MMRLAERERGSIMVEMAIALPAFILLATLALMQMPELIKNRAAAAAATSTNFVPCGSDSLLDNSLGQCD